ncbi:uncharacterized protein LOC125709952 [Brienomyrus brachyistius]|uniref:uncharacterized protein LOC125709952 n=1 Tax=Brienomyrus brachyistius TaxID=42636 RepID=UPI0020B264A2|nr:uncharacterized protein LOC125709952 [Brienomyrus brachyistius]XP_048835001.1 uncharacterized protein LOC125709952 [Brienomyrus brachyistius]
MDSFPLPGNATDFERGQSGLGPYPAALDLPVLLAPDQPVLPVLATAVPPAGVESVVPATPPAGPESAVPAEPEAPATAPPPATALLPAPPELPAAAAAPPEASPPPEALPPPSAPPTPEVLAPPEFPPLAAAPPEAPLPPPAVTVATSVTPAPVTTAPVTPVLVPMTSVHVAGEVPAFSTIASSSLEEEELKWDSSGTSLMTPPPSPQCGDPGLYPYILCPRRVEYTYARLGSHPLCSLARPPTPHHPASVPPPTRRWLSAGSPAAGPPTPVHWWTSPWSAVAAPSPAAAPAPSLPLLVSPPAPSSSPSPVPRPTSSAPLRSPPALASQSPVAPPAATHRLLWLPRAPFCPPFFPRFPSFVRCCLGFCPCACSVCLFCSWSLVNGLALVFQVLCSRSRPLHRCHWDMPGVRAFGGRGSVMTFASSPRVCHSPPIIHVCFPDCAQLFPVLFDLSCVYQSASESVPQIGH